MLQKYIRYLTILIYANDSYAVSYHLVSLRLKIKGYCIAFYTNLSRVLCSKYLTLSSQYKQLNEQTINGSVSTEMP